MNELLKDDKYDRRLRPFFQDKQLNVSVHVTVENFEKLDEKDMASITVFP